MSAWLQVSVWINSMPFPISHAVIKYCLVLSCIVLRECIVDDFHNYSASLRFRAGSLAIVACNSKRVTAAFYQSSVFWIPTEVVYLQRFLVVAWLVPRETAAICSVHSIQPCHVTSCKSHIGRVNSCLAQTVNSRLAPTCHLHFWQNGQDLLRATAVTPGWNGYRYKSQHKKFTMEK